MHIGFSGKLLMTIYYFKNTINDSEMLNHWKQITSDEFKTKAY